MICSIFLVVKLVCHVEALQVLHGSFAKPNWGKFTVVEKLDLKAEVWFGIGFFFLAWMGRGFAFA